MSHAVSPEAISEAVKATMLKIQRYDEDVAARKKRFWGMWAFTSVVAAMVFALNFQQREMLSNWNNLQAGFSRSNEVLGSRGSAQYATDHRELLKQLRELKAFMGTLGYSTAWDSELSPSEKVSFLLSTVDVGIRRLEKVEGRDPASAPAYRALRQVTARLALFTGDHSWSYASLRMLDKYGKDATEKARVAWWIRFLPILIPFLYGFSVYLAEDEE
jgi:hypothetical protein